MNIRRVTLLGGTGFVGRALASRLAADGVQVRLVARHAASVQGLPAGASLWSADVGDATAMRSVLAESDAAVYLPGRVQGRNLEQFRELHALAAQSCASIAQEKRLARFIYFSALGAEATAPAWSDQTKAEGERRVTGVFPGAIVVRPSLVLGTNDHFSTQMLSLMRRLPILPVVGPATRVQPVHIDDMAEALRRLLDDRPPSSLIIQAAGPRVWRIIDLLSALRDQAAVRCRLLALPDWAAMGLATVAGVFPGSPLCRDQVRLMRTDKIADRAHPDLTSLGITPHDPLTYPDGSH